MTNLADSGQKPENTASVSVQMRHHNKVHNDKCIVINQKQAQKTAFLADSECKYMQIIRRAPACMNSSSTVTADAIGCLEGCLGPYGHPELPGCNLLRSSLSPLPLASSKTKQIKGMWVWSSTDCTYTSTYRSLTRTRRKQSSGLSSTQGGCYWHTGGIAPGCSYCYV